MHLASVSSSLQSLPCLQPHPTTKGFSSFAAHHETKPGISVINKQFLPLNSGSRHATPISAAVNEVLVEILDPAQAQVTWEIVIGTLAGVTPFVVAGIEFSKRIVAQKKCNVCKGSGLVLRDKKYYFRCPGCGGFLPWQSWRRFFTG